MAERRPPAVIAVYQRHGETWAALRSDELVEAPWLDHFAAMIPAGGSVLDIGCGSGLPIGRELVRRGYDLTGVDGTPTMHALFRRNLPGRPVHLMDMRQLALRRRFSGLLAWTACSISRPPISGRCSRDLRRIRRRARR